MNSHEPMIPAAAPCEDRQFDLMEFIDGALASDEAARLQRHLVSCARCRAFVDEFSSTSRALAGALPRPSLSPDFDARLRARIAGLSRTTRSDAAREWADREYREALDSLRRGLRWRTALNAAAAASLSGGIVVAAMAVVPDMLAALGSATPAFSTFGLALGALTACVGLTRAARA